MFFKFFSYQNKIDNNRTTTARTLRPARSKVKCIQLRGIRGIVLVGTIIFLQSHFGKQIRKSILHDTTRHGQL